MPKLVGVSHRRAVKAFEKAGFWVVREGKHISMKELLKFSFLMVRYVRLRYIGTKLMELVKRRSRLNTF